MAVVRSHNRVLREAYYSALAGITYNGNAVPVYSDMAPDQPPPIYIIFSGISNNQVVIKSAANFNTSVLVSIYTSAAKYISSNAVDAIADEVLQRITGGLTLSQFQSVSVEVVSDNVENVRTMGQLVAVDRLITFRHRIFQGVS